MKARRLKRFGPPRLVDGVTTSIVVYVKLLLLWLCIMGGDFLLEFRLEYLYPVYLLVHNSYEAYKYQGVAFSLLLIIIVVSVDVICVGALPPNYLFLLATLAVWGQISFSLTPLGPFLLLPVLLYLDGKSVRVQAPLSPLAGHCVGFPLVSCLFALKSLISSRLKSRTRADVSAKNDVLYACLEEALPLEAQAISAPAVDLIAAAPIASPPPNTSPAPQPPPPVKKVLRRKSLELELPEVKKEEKKKRKEECCLRLDVELRKLRCDLHALKTTESDLRQQLHASSSSERGLRSDAASLQAEYEALQLRFGALVQKSQEEKVSAEKRLGEERKKAEVAVGRVRKAHGDCPGDCKRKLLQFEREAFSVKSMLKEKEEKLARVERELQNVKSTLALEQKSPADPRLLQLLSNLEAQNSHLEQSLSAETRLKLDLFSALGEARRQLSLRDSTPTASSNPPSSSWQQSRLNAHSLGVGLGTSLANGN